MNNRVQWNDHVRFIVSDVDETVADLYVEAEQEMISELSGLLEENKSIMFITGQGIRNVQWRIINHLPEHLRQRTLVGHCSGVEVWGFNQDGSVRDKPFYSVYDTELNGDQKSLWRKLVQQVIDEFQLKVYPTMPVPQFLAKSAGDPLSIMMEDRGPQITFEVVNGVDLNPEQIEQLEITIPETHGSYDIRIPIVERADQLFTDAGLPITSRLAGNFAIDFAVKGVSKTTAIKYVLENKDVLSSIRLTTEDIHDPNSLEIWGDKFSTIRGGTDRHMSEALPKEVRSIDFREENPEEFLPGYNTVVWSGEKHLHHGLLEYLQSRKEN